MTSVLISITFPILVLSGALLFASPPGRVANWTILGLRTQEWISLHVWSGALFLAIALVHVLFNWRPLLSYFKDRLTRRVDLRGQQNDLDQHQRKQLTSRSISSTNWFCQTWTSVGYATRNPLLGAAVGEGQLVTVGVQAMILRAQVVPDRTTTNEGHPDRASGHSGSGRQLGCCSLRIRHRVPLRQLVQHEVQATRFGLTTGLLPFAQRHERMDKRHV